MLVRSIQSTADHRAAPTVALPKLPSWQRLKFRLIHLQLTRLNAQLPFLDTQPDRLGFLQILQLLFSQLVVRIGFLPVFVL
jgi:hypothetical protein